MNDNDRHPYHDFHQPSYSITGGKVHERSICRCYRWKVIAAISMLLVLFFASTTFYLWFSRPADGSITPMSHTSPSNNTPPTQAPGVTPLSTSSATVISSSETKTIPMNETLTCTSGCGSVHITITTATISSNADQFTLNLTIDPGTAQGNYYFGNLDIQDESGTTYQPQGQVRDYARFDFVPHQSITLTAIYPFIPQSGLRYTLKTTLSSDTTGIAPEYFGDYQFTF